MNGSPGHSRRQISKTLGNRVMLLYNNVAELRQFAGERVRPTLEKSPARGSEDLDFEVADFLA
jgi:hypothetical protein